MGFDQNSRQDQEVYCATLPIHLFFSGGCISLFWEPHVIAIRLTSFFLSLQLHLGRSSPLFVKTKVTTMFNKESTVIGHHKSFSDGVYYIYVDSCTFQSQCFNKIDCFLHDFLWQQLRSSTFRSSFVANLCTSFAASFSDFGMKSWIQIQSAFLTVDIYLGSDELLLLFRELMRSDQFQHVVGESTQQ